MTFVQNLLDSHTDADNWHQQYPWFSIGQLINAHNKKNISEETEANKKTVVFFNNIPRLHWLLNQPAFDSKDLVPEKEVKEEIFNTNGKIDTQDSAVVLVDTQSLEVPDFSATRFSEKDLLEEKEITNEDSPEITGTTEIEEQSAFNISFAQSLAEAAQDFKSQTDHGEDLAFLSSHQHTIDYFASQGIKLEEEPANDDSFGKQLKTFTSWLRQMKPLSNAVTANDPLVETYAAHSLQQEDVLTESMADVLLKQGKKQAATDVLEKLRLLHPQKTHYFADRIEKIKHS